MFVQYPRRLKAFNFYNFESSHNSFLWPEYFIDSFCENGFYVRLWPSVLCLLFRPKTVHCSAKNACTSEITFLALEYLDLIPGLTTVTTDKAYFRNRPKHFVLRRYHPCAPIEGGKMSPFLKAFFWLGWLKDLMHYILGLAIGDIHYIHYIRNIH